tara:strand:+ start:1523 stop:1879 length:357 start_codon:yes stop_codon:yes gene_type:complete
MNKKFLYFTSGAIDAGGGDEECILIGADNISHFEMDDDTSLKIFAKEGVGQIAQGDSTNNVVIDLTITTGKHKEVMAAIARTINKGPHSNGFCVIADKENEKFCHADITGVLITVIDA